MFVGGCKGGTDATPPDRGRCTTTSSTSAAPSITRATRSTARSRLLAEGIVDWRALAAGPIGLDDLAQTLGSGNAGPARKWVVLPAPV